MISPQGLNDLSHYNSLISVFGGCHIILTALLHVCDGKKKSLVCM